MSESEIIHSQKLNVMINGTLHCLNVALTVEQFEAACEEIRKNAQLCQSFSSVIHSIAEIRRLNSVAPAKSFTIEEMSEIIAILEKNIRYGCAFYVPFIDYAALAVLNKVSTSIPSRA